VILPTLAALVLVGELYAAGIFLMNQPEDWAVIVGGLTLTSIVVVFGVWASWMKRVFTTQKEVK
jgi:hypothetical protein